MTDPVAQTTPARRIQSREERTLRVLWVLAHALPRDGERTWALDEVERLMNECAADEIAYAR